MKKKALKAALREAKARIAGLEVTGDVAHDAINATWRKRLDEMRKSNILFQDELEKRRENETALAGEVERLRAGWTSFANERAELAANYETLYADFQKVVKERDEARHVAGSTFEDGLKELEQTRRDRDEWKAKHDKLADNHRHVGERMLVVCRERDEWKAKYDDLNGRALVVGKGEIDHDVEQGPYRDALATLARSVDPARLGMCGRCGHDLTASEVQDGRTVHVACSKVPAKGNDGKVTGPLRTGHVLPEGSAT